MASPPADAGSSLLATSLTSLRAADALQHITSSAATDSWLSTRAVLLEQRASTCDRIDGTLLADIQDWTRACALGSTEDWIFSSETLASCLGHLQSIYIKLDASEDGKEALLQLCLLVYDLLQDDDEDVRISAALSAVRILTARSQVASETLEPLTASQELLTLMITSSTASPRFASECLSRAFALHSFAVDAIAAHLNGRTPQDTDLFAEEKQNLYLDEVLEAEAWTQAALRLESSIFAIAEVEQLVVFVATGLDLMLRKAQVTPQSVLDWSTTNDVFVYGLRVVYGAELLLHWAEHQAEMSMQPSVLREKLCELSAAAESAQLHPMWRSEFGRVAKMATISGSVLSSP